MHQHVLLPVQACCTGWMPQKRLESPRCFQEQCRMRRCTASSSARLRESGVETCSCHGHAALNGTDHECSYNCADLTQ